MNDRLKDIKEAIDLIRQDKVDCGDESRQERIDGYVKKFKDEIDDKSIEDRWKDLHESYKSFKYMACWFISYNSSVINMAYPYADLLRILDVDITSYARFRFDQMTVSDDGLSFGDSCDGEVKLPLEFFLKPTEFMDKEVERIEKILDTKVKNKEESDKEDRYDQWLELKEEFGE